MAFSCLSGALNL